MLETDSEDSNLDEDGFDKNDPYAAQAKRIQAQEKARKKWKESTVNKISTSVIQNREKMTFVEKNLKNIVVFIVLGCIFISNIQNYDPADYQDFSLLLLFNYKVWLAMERELILLGGSMLAFFGMRALNDYLDRKEAEKMRQYAQERERERMGMTDDMSDLSTQAEDDRANKKQQ